MRKARLTALVLVAVLCWTLPHAWSDDKKNDVDEIGDRSVAHRSIISQEKEIAIGKQYADLIDKQAKILKDPVVNEYVNRVGQNLARNSDLKIPLTVKVIDDPTINAFTLPGGYLYLNTGTILAADEEDQMAGVMAHEIGHAAARHWASTVTRATFLQAAMTSSMIFVPMSYPVYVGVMETYMNGVPLAFLKFSRKQEEEADYLGLQYMYKAGYDPDTFVVFFGKVMDQERRNPGSMAKIFGDHPPTGDRILAAQDEIQKILPQRPEYLVSTSEYDEMRSRLQTLMAQSKRLRKGGNGQDNGATLHKKTSEQTPAQSSGQSGQSSGSNDDSPPVLKRCDHHPSETP